MKRKYNQMSRYRPYTGLGPLALATGRYIGRRVALSRRGRGAGSRTKTGQRSVTSGYGVTTQYDKSLIYRKRNMPKRKKRIWRRFINKVHAVSERDMGTRTVLFNGQYDIRNDVPTNHGCMTLTLYSMRGSANFSDDMFQIYSFENKGDQTAAAGDTVDETTKFMFKSAVLDITIRNSSGTTDGLGNITLNSAAKLELDIYEIMVRTETSDNSSNYLTLSQLFANGTNDSKNIGGAGTGITIQSRGVTPFELPQALSRWRMKILKKTKYFIPNGDTVTYQMRDAKRHVMDGDRMNNNDGFGYRFTKYIYIIFKVVPGLTVGSLSGNFVEKIDVGSTRKYSYKIEGVNEDRDRYVTQSTTLVNPA